MYCVLAVGNKCDREDRFVPTEEAQQLADELKITFVETSAKDNNNVEEVRASVITVIVNATDVVLETTVWQSRPILCLTLYTITTVSISSWLVFQVDLC